MDYSKPKVSIDLEEYNNLKEIKDNQDNRLLSAIYLILLEKNNPAISRDYRLNNINDLLDISKNLGIDLKVEGKSGSKEFKVITSILK